MSGKKGTKRWLTPWAESEDRASVYHLTSRVVDRRFVFGDEERGRFRMFMRMMENFSGCRVLSYCVMSNHFHVLLEVPPMPKGGLSDAELLKRLGVLYAENFVKSVADELASAREEGDGEGGNLELVAEIHGRFTPRMHDLSDFMKTLLQRFTRWFNRTHNRKGTLWEDRFKSVIVESGTAARTIAAYIDLNPVRAGMVSDPADYRWSSYGEAVGGGAKGNGKKAREGLVRACMSHKGIGFEAEKWKEVSRIYRRAMGMALGRKNPQTQDLETQDTRKEDRTAGMNDAEYLEAGADRRQPLPELSMAAMLMKRVRYFTDGATPFSPPSGLATGSFNGLHPKSKFLALETDESRAKWAFREVTGKSPNSKQLPILLELISEQRESFTSKSSDAAALLKVGDSKPDPSLDPVESATFASLAQALLNLDANITLR